MAALGVVLFHAAGMPSGAPPGSVLDVIRSVLQFGFVGVFLFFVISGFCIHLRWAKVAAFGQAPRLEFVPFWLRRARRLYPPYLAALAIYLAAGPLFGSAKPGAPSAYDVVLHVLMLHNLDPRTVFTGDRVFWTLALEEQLYLAYFVLVALRNKLGWTQTLAICLLMRFAWFVLAFLIRQRFSVEVVLHESLPAQWFTWTLGAWSAEMVYGVSTAPRWARNLPAGALCLAAAAGVHMVRATIGDTQGLACLLRPVEDPLWGLGFFILITYLASAEFVGTIPRVPGKALGGLAAVGIISYSLYLTHDLVFLAVDRFLVHPAGSLSGGMLRLALSPLTLLLAWLFFRIAERPFLNPPEKACRK